MQRNCIFPGRYAPLTYYEDVLEASRNMFMARNAREICNFLHFEIHKTHFRIERSKLASRLAICD